MGIRLFSRSSFDETPSYNPDPARYDILDHKVIKNCLILKVNYPDCRNYEGNKILVFANTTLAALRKQQKIDPHFSENKEYISPVARFSPTDQGWQMACKFCEIGWAIE